MQPPKLRRGFGYTSKSVHLVLTDRDASLAQASQRAGAAEAQVLDLRSEAETLRVQLAEQAEQLRSHGAEAADLRTDRDAARRELEGAVADAVRLQLQLTATRRQLETIQNDQEAIQLGSEAARGGPDVREEPVRAAEEGSEIALIREELTSARRQFLTQSRQIRSAEARIEVLETEVRSLRPELEAGLGAAVADLQAARAAVDEVAARTAPDPMVTAEDEAVPEAAGWAAARMNGAGTHAAEELREAERDRGETLVEIERLAASRDRLASLVGEVRSTIEDAGEGAAGIGDRVDEAVVPLTDAIDELNLRLATFAELAALPSEDTREPASERSLNLVELEEQHDDADQLDPMGGVGARTSDEPNSEEAPGPAFEWIVPPAPPPVDQAQRSR
jgi:DNA repair exonuclease SbcCD ATPase subunit